MRRAHAALGLVPLVPLLGCAQILGVEDIPGDAGREASARDGGADATADGRSKDTGLDGATRCAPNGLAVQTYSDGGWGPPQACANPTPVCIQGACACVPGTGVCVGGGFQPCVAGDGGPSLGPVEPCADTCSVSGCGPLPPSCALATPRSTQDGITSCVGPDTAEHSCCASLEVPGGSYYMSHDLVSNGPYYGEQYPRDVSPFRLDRFEVTVGRFRPFLAQLQAGWFPVPGSGKHSHLNGGLGLKNPADAGTAYESGWDPAWNEDLHKLTEQVEAGLPTQDGPLACGGVESTWTPSYDTMSPTDGVPLNCLTWVEAYAFCIWDGGFLPSEAEWNFAAAGGPSQREFPFGVFTGPSDTDASCSYATFVPSSPCTSPMSPMTPAGSTSKGDSLYGQADMAGNVLEWTLDVYDDYVLRTPQTDVALVNLDGGWDASSVPRVQRGGSFISDIDHIRTAVRGSSAQGVRSFVAGVRCARPP